MENEINNTYESNHLCFDNNAKQQLEGARKWAFLISIAGFIFFALGILGILFMLIMLLVSGIIGFEEFRGLGEFEGSFFISIIVISVVYMAVYFFPVYYLYKFSSSSSVALKSNSSHELTKALQFLKMHYIFIVISVAVFIVLYIAFFIIFIMGMKSVFMNDFDVLGY